MSNFFEAAKQMGYNFDNIAPINNMTVQQYPQNPVNTAPVIPAANTQIAPPSPGGLGYSFTVVKDEEPISDKYMLTAPSPIGNMIPDTVPSDSVKKRGRPKKNDKQIVKSDGEKGEVVDESAMYTYSQTTMMLHETVQQIDMVAAEIKDELDNVKLSKTYRNKHNTMIGLSKSLADLLSSKVSAISQINNSISKANELDYKREKDRKDRDASANMDDNTIMNMYNAFISNPYNTGGVNKILGPSGMQATLNTSNIIRSDVGSDNNEIVDAGYLSYLANMTPEQNMMFYEQNPNVKTAVIYDAATGNKTFAVVDITTGQSIPNVPVMDNRFLEDTYIDIKNRIARNNNLHESYPVIILNENVMNEY